LEQKQETADSVDEIVVQENEFEKDLCDDAHSNARVDGVKTVDTMEELKT
jgi:hypothetical protein